MHDQKVQDIEVCSILVESCVGDDDSERVLQEDTGNGGDTYAFFSSHKLNCPDTRVLPVSPQHYR